ncbi:hypothetical protein OsccyDRAFT_5057 [Leptolyngbyaceae cyanobacterium JSC-12]|nr:hypothetical protein OsccyDRAFT_5057 [Leptolyngbyaceae cyanobacterium JSC-12]
MSPWIWIVIILIAGGLGGFANAFLGGEGIPLPCWKDGIWCPGIIGNTFVGSMGAFISWGLYGSGSGVDLSVANNPRTEVSLTIGAFAGAMLVGVGGARWLSNEVDKKFLRETVVESGKRNLSPEDRKDIANASPRKALAIARSCPQKDIPA